MASMNVDQELTLRDEIYQVSLSFPEVVDSYECTNPAQPTVYEGELSGGDLFHLAYEDGVVIFTNYAVGVVVARDWLNPYAPQARSVLPEAAFQELVIDLYRETLIQDALTREADEE